MCGGSYFVAGSSGEQPSLLPGKDLHWHLTLGEPVLQEYFNRELTINCISSAANADREHGSKLEHNPSSAEPTH